MRGARYRFGEIFAFAAGAPAPDCLGRENDERNPDERERDQMRSREWFVKKKDAEEKTAAWREVLEEAEGR